MAREGCELSIPNCHCHQNRPFLLARRQEHLLIPVAYLHTTAKIHYKELTIIVSMSRGASPEAIAVTVALYFASSRRRLIANN